MRRVSSEAALEEKVRTRISALVASPLLTRSRYADASAWVLPAPGPARMRSGPRRVAASIRGGAAGEIVSGKVLRGAGRPVRVPMKSRRWVADFGGRTPA